MMNKKAVSYMNCVVSTLMERYDLTEIAAREAIKESYLFEALQKTPEEAMHDSVNTSADDVYLEIFGK